MTNRPNEPDTQGSPSEGQNGGWRQPSGGGTGGWRVPERPADAPAEIRDVKSAPRQEPGWNAPVLPRNLDVQPQSSGGWHRPKPEDTTVQEVESDPAAAEGDEVLAADGSAGAEAAAPADVLPQEPLESAEPVIDVLPFDSADAPPDDEAEAQPLPTMEDDEEDTGISMSELIALASLADQQLPQTAAPASEAEAPPADPAADPAAYAREQLARLQSMDANVSGTVSMSGTQPSVETGAGAPVDPGATGPMDPAAYARQQLEKLSDSQRLAAAIEAGTAGTPVEPAAPVAVQAPTLSPQEEVLAARYRSAEEAIRALRDQYLAGQITRDQLQNELRNYMVLDDANRYWMMGFESDSWYVYENNEWMLRTPDVLARQQAAQPSPTLTSEAAGGLSLQYLADRAAQDVPLQEGQTVPTSPIYDDDMPLPRRVPVLDLEATVPNTQGVYLGEQDPNVTVVANPYGNETVATGVTVANPRLAGYESVEAPIPPAPPTYNVEEVTPNYERALEAQRARTFRTIGLVTAAVAALLFLVAAGVVILGVVTYNNIAEPWRDEIAALANYRPPFQTARIYAADGETLLAELASRSGGARETIDLADIAPEMIHAVVSLENERYFDDPGFDPIAIGRAFLDNLSAGEITSGASTITQQIARNLVLRDNTVSADRKLQEIVIAAEIAQQYDKSFILELYLNEVFFGNQAYGVEAAAQFYFGVSAADVNLPQAAMLAGLIQAPATYDPVINREAAFARMNQVLTQMAAVGCLQFTTPPYDTPATAFCVNQQQIASPQTAVDKARVETRAFLPRSYRVQYPHFVNYVQAVIERDFGSSEEIFRRGMQITTTLNPALQQLAEAALDAGVNQLTTNAVNTGAVLVADPRSGAILAMVGSPDFANEQIDGQVNNVFTWQQPGSAIKPILYTAALEGVTRNNALEYYTPATILWDVPVTYQTVPPYAPVNFDGRFRGPVAMRFALQNSYNVPAVKTLEWLGLDRFRETSTRMGLRFLPEQENSIGLAAALGGFDVRLYDMVQSYSTLANNGVRVPMFSIQSITDTEGNEIAQPTPRAAGSQQVQPQIAYLMQSILSDNEARSAAFGPNSGLNLPQFPGRVAAKTGTSNESRDLWTMGFANNITVGVWLGRNDNNPTINTTQTNAVPVWNAIMSSVLTAQPPAGWTAPSGVVQLEICADTGTLLDATNQQTCRNRRQEIFAQAQLPPAPTAGFVQQLPIDTWTRQIANENCPNNVVTEQFLALRDASAVAWLLNTADGRAYVQANNLPTQTPPTTACAPGQTLPQVEISSPAEGQAVSETIQITGTVLADNFNRYQIELAPAGTQNYQVISGPFGQQGQNGVIGQWDSRTVQNGNYTLRLAAFSNNGGFLYRTRNIVVNNIPPTPTVTPSPTNTPPPTFAPFTPLPFDTPIGGGAQVLPGATATPQGFIPLGQLSDVGATPTSEF
ncbi:MAG: transglycosylase domain-containing protein [bacterium]|nr:transglycosylase domain-containing protein [bacterium]